MLYYDRIDTSKSSDSKECVICHYCFFLNNGFKYQDSVCNCCHDLIMLCLSINNMAIITGKGIDYYCIIHDITKSEVIHLLEK